MTEPAEIAGRLLAEEIRQAAFNRADAIAEAALGNAGMSEDQRLAYEIGRSAGYAAALIELSERQMFKGQEDD